MGRQGPCYHCGVTSTPLWRNGPPEKPVLCNACGSRWRTKGTLANYMPLQARLDHDEVEDHKISKTRTAFTKNNERAKVLKRNFEADNTRFTEVHPEYYKRASHKGLDDDATNRSSSGSVISNAETCAQYGCTDIGSSEPHVWDTMMPSRKRTCVTRPKQSPVEKLTKDLHTILHDQRSSSCYESSEEDLLFVESYKEMTSVETAHGSVLIHHPSSIIPCDEDSEASSIPSCNKNSNLYSRKDRYDQLEKLQIQRERSSPLCYIDTKNSKGKGVINDSEVVSPESSFAITTNSSIYKQRSSSRDVKQQTPSSLAGNVSASICSDKEVITVQENILSFDKNGSFMRNNGDDEDLEHDLLLELPYNGSFMEAELLQSSESRGSIKH